MKSFNIASVLVAGLVLTAPAAAKETSVAGPWTLTVEQHFGLKLELEQKKSSVTGTLAWPHGDPIKLTGALKGNTLTFTGDSQGDNFSVHVDSVGTLNDDGTMTGNLKALFIDYNEKHEVLRKHDQDIPWTAERGLHNIVNFSR